MWMWTHINLVSTDNTNNTYFILGGAEDILNSLIFTIYQSKNLIIKRLLNKTILIGTICTQIIIYCLAFFRLIKSSYKMS